MNYFKIIYLNLCFYPFFIIFSAVSIPILMLLIALSAPFISRRQKMKLVHRFLNFYGIIVTKLPFPFIRVYHDTCNKNNGPGPFIFICNHRSALDPFLMWCIPYEFIQVASTWPFSLPALGISAKLAEYININSMSHEKFLQKSLSLLEDGVSIVFFPEGTRSINREMSQFHSAAFRLALQTKVPIVPLCISGTGQVLLKGRRMIKPGKIKVHMLPAIRWDDFKDWNAFSLKNRVRSIIQDELTLMDSSL